jgi:hypothetical protein
MIYPVLTRSVFDRQKSNEILELFWVKRPAARVDKAINPVLFQRTCAMRSCRTF